MKKKPLIQSTLKVMGKTFNAEGTTVEEAILNLKPNITKATGVLRVIKGSKFKERIVQGPVLHRVFGNHSESMKQISGKSLVQLFPKELV